MLYLYRVPEMIVGFVKFQCPFPNYSLHFTGDRDLRATVSLELYFVETREF